MSSIKVCGEGADQPYRENHPPQPGDAYARSKWEAEQALWEITGGSAMTATVLRPPLVYGPGVGANFLRLLRAVDRGLPLPLAKVNNRRSLIYVGNLADAVVRCLDAPEVAGQTFHVADAEAVSTPDLVRVIAKALGRPARLFPVPAEWLERIGRLTGRRETVARLSGSLTVDTSLIRSRLGWHPPASLPEGIAETVVWYRSTQGKGRSSAR